MNFRTITVLTVLTLLALFAGINWPAFTQPTKLNLLFTQTETPLGTVMLGVVAVLTVLYVLFTLGIEAAALTEVRRYARDLHQARKLLEKEEESRFVNLKAYLEAELAELREELQAIQDQLQKRTQELKAALQDESGSLSTQIDSLKVQHKEILQRIDRLSALAKETPAEDRGEGFPPVDQG